MYLSNKKLKQNSGRKTYSYYILFKPSLPKICGYEAKWLTGSSYFKLSRPVEANLDKETENQIISCSQDWQKDWNARID